METKKINRLSLFSPAGLLVRAAIICLIFGFCFLAGLKEYTCFLSGTSATGEAIGSWPLFLGMCYLAGYFAFILLVPVFVLSAGILWLIFFCKTKLS